MVKTNLCRLPPPLGVVLEENDCAVPTLRYSEAPPDTQSPTQTALRPTGGPLASGTPGRTWRGRQASRCGHRRRRAGFSRATLYRARWALGGAIEVVGTGPRDPQKRWVLAGPVTTDKGIRP